MVTNSLCLLITPSHVSVLTANVHVTPAFGWSCGFTHVTFAERVLEEQFPQFVVIILYLIAGQLDMTGFQVKVSCLDVALDSVTLVGGRSGTALIIKDNQLLLTMQAGYLANSKCLLVIIIFSMHLPVVRVTVKLPRSNSFRPSS